MGGPTDGVEVDPGGVSKAGPVRQASPARGLRVRVLVPLTAAIAAVLLAFVWMFVRESRQRRAEDVARTAALVDDLMRAQLADGVQVMRSVMELLMRDQRLEAALRARDRQLLLEVSEPLLKEIRERNRITHFYYILPDRTS